MSYSNAVAFLDSLRDLERGDAFDPDPSKYLPRVRWMLETLGSPEKRFRSVIVGGTNGKGTVSSLLAHLLGECGLRVGLYTSPHLRSLRERIRLGGKCISRRELAAGVDRLRLRLPLDGDLPFGEYTKFEVLTVLAVHAFAENGIDVGVLEVGLGGRFDATNAWDSSVAALTNIGVDHAAILGDTVEEIAADKVWIARAGRRLHTVTSQPPEVGRLLRRQAARLGVELVEVEPATADDLLRPSAARPGRYRDNAALAVSLALDLANEEIGALDLREVISGHAWPGRFEVVRADPPVILDGAHNPDAVGNLIEDLRRLAEEWSFVFGATSGHDAGGMLELLGGAARQVVVTTTRHPRGVEASELLHLAEPRNPVDAIENPARAIDLLLSRNVPVCVTGSLHLVAEARAHLGLPDACHEQ